MATWKTLDLNLGTLDTAIDTVQDVADVLIATQDVAKTVLSLLRVFTVPGIPDPVTPILEVVLQQLQSVLDSLGDTGAFGLAVVPTTTENLLDLRGGYTAFQRTLVASFYDTDDMDRPQIGSTGVLGGIVIYLNSTNPAQALERILALLELFGRSPTLRFPAPINVRATPADDQGIAAPSLLELFTGNTSPQTTLLLEWEEPKITRNVFYDLFASNKFYVERSKSRQGVLLTREAVEAPLLDPLARRRQQGEAQGETSRIVRDPVLNRQGEPQYVWEPVDPTQPFIDAVNAQEGESNRDINANFIAGTYSVVLRGLPSGEDEGYYYRVRSVPEDVQLASRPVTLVDGNREVPVTIYELTRGGRPYTESLPSSPVYGFIPNLPPQTATSFDLPTALLNVYRAAYLYRMDTTVFNALSQPLTGSALLTPPLTRDILDLEPDTLQFDGTGDVRDAFANQNPAGFVSFTDPENGEYFEGTLYPDGVTSYSQARRRVETLGSVTQSNALEEDPFSGARELFAERFGLSPRARFQLYIDEVAVAKVERIVPLLLRQETLLDAIRQAYIAGEALIQQALTGFTTEGDLLTDLATRDAIARVLVLCDGQIRSGQLPNWESIRLFRDIIPEVDIVGSRLKALLDSLGGTLGNIQGSFDATLDGIEARLAILDTTLEILDGIISTLENLSQGLAASLLFIPPGTGGVAYFVDELLQATNTPQTLPSDYGAGYVIAAGGAGPQDAQDLFLALRFIFGL
jgi:hypothetical protein